MPPAAQPDDHLVIFPAEQAREFSTPRADDYWTPSEDDARAAATAIAAHLAKHAASNRLDRSDEWFNLPTRMELGQYMQDGAKFILPRLSTYRAQFAGVIRHGKKMIAANYLCAFFPDPDRASYWLRHRWHVVSDGGPCFFHFFYEPRDGSIHDLALNGQA